MKTEQIPKVISSIPDAGAGGCRKAWKRVGDNFKFTKMIDQEQSTPSLETPVANQPILVENDSQAKQISELGELTRSLMSAVQALQTQNARNDVFQEAVSDIKAATRAVLLAPAAVGEQKRFAPHEEKPGKCCSTTSCISEDCCAYDIFMTHVRVLNMQTEPIDSNIDTIEVRMFASIDGIGAVIPNMFSVITLHKLVNQLGVWTQINQRIGTVVVPKGAPKTFTISVDAVEVEEGIVEQATAIRDEYGTGSGAMTLDCCCSVAPTITFDIDFTGGGQGGGAIAAKFTAVKK